MLCACFRGPATRHDDEIIAAPPMTAQLTAGTKQVGTTARVPANKQHVRGVCVRVHTHTHTHVPARAQLPRARCMSLRC
jgi:hypothetical protein